MRKFYSLYGRLLDLRGLYNAFKQVKRAKGAAGIDRQSLSDFEQNLVENLTALHQELSLKTYQPQPVKRVEIPKDGGGIRLLGVPTVRDRIVQQAIVDVLDPIFDPNFHPSSYGYRKGRSCHHAINKASIFIRQYQRQYVVDMDLSKCFDMLDHDLIIESIKRRVTDGSLLKLIRQFLESGVMINGTYEPTTIGSPQGGVISPLIANIYLDRFDQQMMARNHRIVRYADDILILCCTKKAAENAYATAEKILEGELKLEINKEKSHIAHSDEGIKFLGVEIKSRYTQIQPKKLTAFKNKVRDLTRRNGGKPLLQVIKELNPLLRGFSQYFRIANASKQFKALAGWIRRRLRSIQLRLWKKPERLHRWLKQHNYKPPFKHINMRVWNSSKSPLASYAMPNQWLTELGLFNLETVSVGKVFTYEYK